MKKILVIVLFLFCMCVSVCAKSVLCTNVDSLVNDNIQLLDSILNDSNGKIRIWAYLDKYGEKRVSDLYSFLYVINILAGIDDYDFFDNPHDPTIDKEKIKILKVWLLEYKDYLTCDKINIVYRYSFYPPRFNSLDELDKYYEKIYDFKIIKR